MNKKFLIAIIAVFALMIGAIIYLLVTNGKPTSNNGTTVADPRDNYIRLLSGNLAEQLNTYSYNDYSNLRIAYSQSTESYKPEIEGRIGELEQSQTTNTSVVTEANRAGIKYSENTDQLNVTVPVVVTSDSGTKTSKIYKLQLIPVENDWLLAGASLE